MFFRRQFSKPNVSFCLSHLLIYLVRVILAKLKSLAAARMLHPATTCSFAVCSTSSGAPRTCFSCVFSWYLKKRIASLRQIQLNNSSLRDTVADQIGEGATSLDQLQKYAPIHWTKT